jgi:catechol 2,3-dioxygenase-like lactoylglutathione lyase family enzyme
MAIVRMLHLALGVSDVARACAFYRDALGFTVLGEVAFVGSASGRALGVAGDAFDAVLLERDGLRLELLRRTDASGATPLRHASLSHLAVAVDDLAATLHSLRDRGVTVLQDTLTEHAAGVRSCLVLDPDGLPIALYQAPAGVASPWDATR